MKRCVFLLFLGLTSAFSQNVIFSDSTIEILDEEIYRNSFNLFPMEIEKLDFEEMGGFDRDKDRPADDVFTFYFVYKGDRGYYQQNAVIHRNENYALLSTIPEMPIGVYPSSTYSCYLGNYEKWKDLFVKYCHTKVPIPSEFRDKLDSAFSKEYMSLSGPLKNGPGDYYQYSYISNGFWKGFHIGISADLVSNLPSFFEVYKEIYSLTKKYLMKVSPECTWENTTSKLESLCGNAGF